MKKHKIEQEKQENGIWGISTLCYSIDRFILLDDRKHLLFSAALALISQIYKRPFKIFNSTNNGFSIEIGGGRIVGFRYARYEIDDNILYEFETDKEHIAYLRKYKIKTLNNICK